ncbi:MAG: tartrate dehydrogenase, partial [Acetobacteraceae bacterium]|nr:tartrate dehydrogenase [Acetobacteraceae bacterium]
MKTYRIAAMGGDGIGPDVIKAGCHVLQALAEKNGSFALDFQDFNWGSDYYRRTGRMMPEDGLKQL